MTRWSDIRAGDLQSANQRLWAAFGDDAGLIASALTPKGQDLAKRIATFVRRELKLMANFDLAREIMGNNFFGPAEASEFLSADPSSFLNEGYFIQCIPFSADTLERFKETHTLVAVFNRSILDLCVKCPNLFHASQNYSRLVEWKNDWEFATRTDVGWHLVSKKPNEGSYNRNWNSQLELLDLNGYAQVPTSQVVVYTIVGHFLATGERLLAGKSVRCSDFERGGQIVIGMNDEGLITIGHAEDADCTDELGLAWECKREGRGY